MKVALVAGGTGGHINAALSLGEHLKHKGVKVRYFTGRRPLDFRLFANENVSYLHSQPLRYKNPFRLFFSLLRNSFSFLYVFFSFLLQRPRFVIGTGGYVCGPTLLAGKILFIPVFIFEQNAVAGLTNRVLAKIANKVFVHFVKTKGFENIDINKISVVGNPTRSGISERVFKNEYEEKVKILIFGGSLGATQINDFVEELTDHLLEISILHQTGFTEFTPRKVNPMIEYKQLNYIDDMAQSYEWCNIIIARSGASTISELRFVQKPSFLIPYPRATDNHQWFNAKVLMDEAHFPVKVVDHSLNSKEMVESFLQFYEGAKSHKYEHKKEASPTIKAVSEILEYVFPQKKT